MSRFSVSLDGFCILQSDPREVLVLNDKKDLLLPWALRVSQIGKFYSLGELLVYLLPGSFNFEPIHQLRETTGSCQWLLTDWSLLTHRSSGSSPLQPTTWSCTRTGCCQGNRETSFWVTGCQIASALSSSRAIPSSFPQVSRVGKSGFFSHFLYLKEN